jgi:DNA-directed RNA polymerase alpha subunit
MQKLQQKKVEDLYQQKKIKATAPIGTIFTDSIYTPIKNVKYAIEKEGTHKLLEQNGL